LRPYLSIGQLAAKTPWSVEAIRKMMVRGVLKERKHYFRPFGQRHGLVFKWSAIVALIEQPPAPMVELAEAHPEPRSAGMNVEQATANLQRLLG
jgi:hypothetical protein